VSPRPVSEIGRLPVRLTANSSFLATPSARLTVVKHTPSCRCAAPLTALPSRRAHRTRPACPFPPKAARCHKPCRFCCEACTQVQVGGRVGAKTGIFESTGVGNWTGVHGGGKTEGRCTEMDNSVHGGAKRRDGARKWTIRCTGWWKRRDGARKWTIRCTEVAKRRDGTRKWTIRCTEVAKRRDGARKWTIRCTEVAKRSGGARKWTIRCTGRRRDITRKPRKGQHSEPAPIWQFERECVTCNSNPKI